MLFNLFKSLSRRVTGVSLPSQTVSRITVSDEELLRNSTLFDPKFYLETYPDVACAGVDPIEHYLNDGGREGRQPSSKFDSATYLQDYEDVRVAGMNPLVHFLRYGQAEGRHATLDGTVHADSVVLPAEEVSLALQTLTPRAEHFDLGYIRRIIKQSGFWDEAFYCRIYPDIDPKHIDPLEHYVQYGGKEGRRPHPLFDGQWYVSEYPDVIKSGVHPLIHYLEIGVGEGRLSGVDPKTVRIASEMVRQAGSIESTILLDPVLAEPAFLRMTFGGQGWSGLRAWQNLFDSLANAYTYVVFAPWLVRGGADLAAANAVKAAVEIHGKDSTLIVLTDSDRTDAIDWLPDGTHMRVLSAYGPNLSRSDRTLMVELLIRTIRPKAVLNVNSGACWDAFVQKGGALGNASDLYACLFCRDFTEDGRAHGYADTHFRDSLKYLKKIYFDNERFLTELIADYGVPMPLHSRLSTLHQPISGVAKVTHTGGPSPRNRVMWAGRFCAQKNVDLLIKIAEKATSLKFDIYGYGDEIYTRKLQKASARLSNIVLKGAFSATSSLPVDDYNVFLYTSLWDGLPLTLADVAHIGIPIVASAVGGIPDLIRPDTGWLIETYTKPEAYVRALNDVCENPGEANARSKRMTEWVQSEHSWSRFVNDLQISPSFID